MTPPKPDHERQYELQCAFSSVRKESNIERVPFSGCWIWVRYITEKGYGKAGPYMAHRLSYILNKGQIADDLQIDHLCRVRSCINPSHLEAVTQRVNTLRGIGTSAENARKTHCPKGHEYTPENTHVRKNGFRACKACIAIRIKTPAFLQSAKERSRRLRERNKQANALRDELKEE